MPIAGLLGALAISFPPATMRQRGPFRLGIVLVLSTVVTELSTLSAWQAGYSSPLGDQWVSHYLRAVWGSYAYCLGPGLVLVLVGLALAGWKSKGKSDDALPMLLLGAGLTLFPFLGSIMSLRIGIGLSRYGLPCVLGFPLLLGERFRPRERFRATDSGFSPILLGLSIVLVIGNVVLVNLKARREHGALARAIQSYEPCRMGADALCREQNPMRYLQLFHAAPELRSRLEFVREPNPNSPANLTLGNLARFLPLRFAPQSRE